MAPRKGDPPAGRDRNRVATMVAHAPIDLVQARATPIRIVHPEISMSHNKKTLTDLLASLDAAEAPHVLIGGLVAGYYGKARATVDVDMLVPRRARARLLGEMVVRGYRTQESTDMVRFYRRNETEAAADVVWLEANPVLRAASKETLQAVILGKQVTAVNRGAFVALKFNAAISPTRRMGDKYIDAADIMHTMDREFTAEDEALAVKIAGKIYTGAGRELVAMLEDIRQGRRVNI